MALASESAAVAGALFFGALAEQLVDVRIEGYQYQPAEVTIRAGDSVRWTNHEKRTSHSVLFPRDGGLESERMFPERKLAEALRKAGRYDYHCGPHPEMKGVVVVGE
jgi:plastocyanin